MTFKNFSGFPDNCEVTPIPNLLFTKIMPEIREIAELKVALYIFCLISRQREYPRFIKFSDLLTDNILMDSIDPDKTGSRDGMLKNALNLAVQHGIFLQFNIDIENKNELAYSLNTEAEKQAINSITKGETTLSDQIIQRQKGQGVLLLSDIFSVYERNIGMITPMIADELREAEKTYPLAWIEDAFKEAVLLNKRNWKYIARILERWAIEGKNSGKYGRYPEKKRDPDK